MNSICGPDAMATGWIPYYKHIGDVPANAFTRHKHSWPAFSMLFDSGNETPPTVLSGYRDWWDKIINEKEFRGGNAIIDVKLFCGEEGYPSKVTYKYKGFVGYTPANVQINWDIAGNPKVTVANMGGDGSEGSKVEWERDCAIIKHWIRFKIGKVGNLGNWMFTGQWAPYAWMMIRYKICCDGKVEISFGGSFIPSQWYYVKWAQVGTYDMLNITEAQIDGFLNAGDCKDAPGAYHYTWRGRGSQC
ncbi:hypothetical protein [Marinigracilibium pacificum]|uniref:Uncharacterized protein n=1 Tax=Marinigracilibium pacificum TaxID=2729599 RepID=A0A848J8L3_9BACT|nr:hypothetical protein [Marinigracilibium pacificum]NMM50830.1 hypothetical protein [Marinigracilibium pacificum]